MQRGRYVDEIEIGEKASMDKTFTEDEVRMFAKMTGDYTAYHLDDEVARRSIFGAKTVHGMFTAALVSAVCASRLPGPGTFGVDVYVKLVAPVYIGDTITAGVEVIEKDEARNRVRVKLCFVNQHGKEVLVGDSWCIPPRRPATEG